MQDNITELRNCSSSNVPGNPYSHVTTGSSSLPSRKADRGKGALRHVSAAPRIPNTLRRVTPFSRDSHSSYERVVEVEAQIAGLALPSSPMLKTEDPTKGKEPPFDSGTICLETKDSNNPNSILEDAREKHRLSSSETLSFSSWYGKLQLDEAEPRKDLGSGTKQRPHASSQGERLFPSRSQSQASGIAQPYDGFPPELLELEYDKENRIPNYVSKTLPRMPGTSASELEFTDTPSRERSFHDDRAMLPSQRRAPNGSDMDTGGVRTSSLWF
jgi:metal transporter CNNM